MNNQKTIAERLIAKRACQQLKTKKLKLFLNLNAVLSQWF